MKCAPGECHDWLSTMDKKMKDIEILESALKRARSSLHDAEQLLEQKTLELYERNETLAKQNQNLELLNLELQEKQGMILQADKMASIGQLAAGVAHEVNNPIAYILINNTSLKEYVDSYDKLYQMVSGWEKEGLLPEALKEEFEEFVEVQDMEFIREDIMVLLKDTLDGCNHVKDIVQGLKDFSRTAPDEFHEVKLSEIIETCLKVANFQLDGKCEVHKDFQVVPPVPGNSGQLNQVFLNLIVNAAQAMKRGGNLWISIRPMLDLVEVKVRDDGCGMDEATIDSAFTPFFTTKEIGEGTGLGLSVVLGILKAHNARINVESKPNEGTCFSLYFKTCEDDSDSVKRYPLTELKTTLNLSDDFLGSFTLKDTLYSPKELFAALAIQIPFSGKDYDRDVLIVEDVEAIRLSLVAMVQKRSLFTDQVSDAFECLEKLMNHRYRLIILDMGLPFVSGTDLLIQFSLAFKRVGTKVLVSSAFPASQIRQVLDLGADEFLEKPVRQNSLATKLDNLGLTPPA